MNRREVLGALGATAVSLGMYASVNSQAVKKADKHADDHSSNFDVCAKAFIPNQQCAAERAECGIRPAT